MKTASPISHVAAAIALAAFVAPSLSHSQEGGPQLDIRPDGDSVEVQFMPPKTVLQFSESLGGPWEEVAMDPTTPGEPASTSIARGADGNGFFRVVTNGLPTKAQPIIPEGFFPDRENTPRPTSIRVDYDRSSPKLYLAYHGIDNDCDDDPDWDDEFATDGMFPILIGGEIIIVRDDGKAGDEKAGDCIFTGDIDVPEEERRELDEALARLGESGRGIPVLEGRSVRPDPIVSPFGSDPDKPGGITLGTQISRPSLPPLVPIPGLPGAISEEHSLLIRSPRVVDDPERTFDPCSGQGTPLGAWTFGKLMTDMANTPVSGIAASDFVRRWITHWTVDQSINMDVVPERDAAIRTQILDSWETASGGPGEPLNLERAPFRLCAIVNRIDLGGSEFYGSGEAGELRFVYCAIDANGEPITTTRPSGDGRPYGGGNPDEPSESCAGLPVLVILEYSDLRDDCRTRRALANRWADLSDFTLGSPDYNAALQAITDTVVTANKAPDRPNGSAINQVRSNEILTRPWDMREWKLFDCDADAGHLRQVTTKRTPIFEYNNPGTPLNNNLAAFINASEPQILAEAHDVPLTWMAQAFLSGHSPIAPGSGMHWNADGITNNNARHLFSLNTCNACHGGETGTDFTHISERPFGSPSTLSGFLTGISHPDPVDSTPRNFADLTRRAAVLDSIIRIPCRFQFAIPRLSAEH